LEREGVLKSWAVPKGPPEAPGEKRLAIETEDHPLDYGSFEGTIPEGEYGAGNVKIWDRGFYEPLHWGDEKIEVLMKGERLVGRYELVRFKRAGEKEWLFFKAKD
jgi:bifunctional non-homologous end joining protein LigD